MTVVVDASVAIKWVVPEEDSVQALQLRSRWLDNRETLIAPGLFAAEVTNVLYQKVRRGSLNIALAQDAADTLLPAIALADDTSSSRRALEMSASLGVGATYDCMYLTLAESEDCEFWTADRRFVRMAQSSFPRVRWLGEVA